MLKKLLFLSFIISVLAHANLFAQCIPNSSITTPGVYPDSATGLPGAYVGTPYNEVVQVRVPVDTVYLGQTIPIINFTIDSIVGLPPGFTYACVPVNCIFPGGSNGCILLSSANPTAVGTFVLNVFGTANGTLFGQPAALPFNIDYYKIVIYPASGAGVPQNSNYSFNVSQNEPNPFSVFSNINFTSPTGGKAELKIYNMIGKEIYNGEYRVITGKNTIRLDAKEFESGIYMYTLAMGDRKVTKRFVISKK